MKWKKLIFTFLCFLIFLSESFSQCLSADFDLPSSACRAQNLILTNNLSAGQYVWDFCTGELNNAPTAQTESAISGAVGRPGIEIVKDGNKWYGFVTGTWTNSLYRLEFGNGIDQPYTAIVNLGDLGGILNNPGQIRIIKEGNGWFGIIHNTGTAELLKLNFGDNLSNSITTSLLMSGVGTSNSGFALDKDATHGWVCVISQIGNTLAVLRLGNDIQAPTPTDILVTPQIPNPNNLGDVDILKICNEWYGIANNFGGGNIYRLKFGSNLFSLPQIDQIASLSISNGGRLRLAQDGEEFFLLVTSLDGVLYKLKFGNDFNSTPTINNEGNLQNVLQVNTYGLAMIKENSVWIALVVDQSNGQLYRLNHEQNCSASPKTSTEAIPVLTYLTSGIYNISLQYTSGSDSFAKTKNLNISSLVSPDINFTTQNICVNNDVNFTSQNISGNIVTYDWDFGDNTAHSSGNNATHQYSSSSQYNVILKATASNGCENTALKTVKIYPEPVSVFTMPSGLICTNNQFDFDNATTGNFEGNLTYQWFVDNELQGTNRDLKHTFLTTGIKAIKLVSAIPGCSDEIIQMTSEVAEGPIVDFSFEGICKETTTQFISGISEPVTNYSWNFGDGNFSSAANPQHLFAESNDYIVTLTATSSSGCNNSKAKTITIYSKPQPDFAVQPPPFSCSDGLTDFTNTTPDPSDSNILSWAWNFDDPGAENSSVLQNPNHTFANAGVYNVSLTVTTDAGCSNILQKEISIAQSPFAVISNSYTCKNIPVNFMAVGDEIQSYYWEMGTSYYLTDKPVHIFNTSGVHSVKLTITGNNNCVTVYNNSITIPIPLSSDFSVTKNCVGYNAIFTDLTTGTDLVATRQWTFPGATASTTDPSIEFLFNSAGNKEVNLQVTGQSGCTYSTTKNINVVPAPKANFTTIPVIGATPLKVQFNNESSYATAYTWSFPDGGVTTSTQFSPSFTFQELGEHLVELVASNSVGCSDKLSKIITVETPLPDVDLKLISTSENLDGSLKVIITVHNKGNTILENLPVEINISGNTILREIIETPIAPSSMYNLVLSYGITKTTNLKFLCAEAELENDQATEGNRICTEFQNRTFIFSSYPNPVHSELKIEWIADNDQMINIFLSDAFGKAVLRSELLSIEGLNQMTFNVEKLQSGIYFLIIKDGFVQKTQRIFISPKN